jgi:transposase
MAAPYSDDLRLRVLAAYDAGMQTREISKRFSVCEAWAKRIKQVRQQEGRTSALPMGGARNVKINMDRLKQLVDEQPDATIAELHKRLGIECCESAVAAALSRLGLTFKKRRSTPANRIVPMSRKSVRNGGRISQSNRRSAWFSLMKPGRKPT